MSDLLAAGLGPELLIRILATALVVIGVTLAVERLGPTIGGALAGLPMVIGPGFYFIAREHPEEFTSTTAAASLLSLCATEAFLLAYIVVAARRRPAMALTAAALTWALGAVLLSPIPSRPELALALFVLALLAARAISRRYVRPTGRRKVTGGLPLLVARGMAAGILVAVATLAAGHLGPAWAGFIVTYPIGFSVISVTVHQRFGTEIAIVMLHAAMLGVASLAAFSFMMAVGIEALGATWAFSASLAASVAVTSLLALRATAPRGP